MKQLRNVNEPIEEVTEFFNELKRLDGLFPFVTKDRSVSEMLLMMTLMRKKLILMMLLLRLLRRLLLVFVEVLVYSKIQERG